MNKLLFSCLLFLHIFAYAKEQKHSDYEGIQVKDIHELKEKEIDLEELIKSLGIDIESNDKDHDHKKEDEHEEDEEDDDDDEDEKDDD